MGCCDSVACEVVLCGVRTLSCLPTVLSGPTRSALQAMLANLGSEDDLPAFESESPNASSPTNEDPGRHLTQLVKAASLCG